MRGPSLKAWLTRSDGNGNGKSDGNGNGKGKGNRRFLRCAAE
jgi:hypothetical protein